LSNDQPVPETRGVTVEVLATVDLAGEIEGLGGRDLRMGMMTMEPGGVFGPLHDHVDRPGTVYVLEGTITDHRDGVVTDYGPGVGWLEDRNTLNWLENRGTTLAVPISVDIVRRQAAVNAATHRCLGWPHAASSRRGINGSSRSSPPWRADCIPRLRRRLEQRSGQGTDGSHTKGSSARLRPIST
jgi:quercetin dioxygenase-like cupin family protein